MHSPWGIEFNIIKETGWTRKYVLWGESWANIQLMFADAPYFKTPPKNEQAEDEISEPESIEQLNNFFN